MTVKEYLKENPRCIAYTIKANKQSFLCNIFEANSYFGDREIAKVTSKYNNDNLPILHIN